MKKKSYPKQKSTREGMTTAKQYSINQDFVSKYSPVAEDQGSTEVNE